MKIFDEAPLFIDYVSVQNRLVGIECKTKDQKVLTFYKPSSYQSRKPIKTKSADKESQLSNQSKVSQKELEKWVKAEDLEGPKCDTSTQIISSEGNWPK